MIKRMILNLFLIGISFSLFALELIPTKQLLASYLEKDSELKKAAIELQKEKLNHQSTEIDEGFDVQLSTGTMKINLKNMEWSVKPEVKVTLPQYSNLGISLSSDVGNSFSESLVNNVSLKLSADVLSSSMEQRNYNLLLAERKITEAQRNLASKALEKEKAFYNELSGLLKSISNIISKQQNYYDDKISFEKVKAQGYAKTSSTYRRAEMAVVSDEHEIETQERSLANNYKLFYIKCGYEIEVTDIGDYMSLIPTDIEQMEGLDIRDYEADKYTEIEKALWTNKINTLKRNLDKEYSLGANAGYTFNNTGTNSDSVDLGLDGSYGGLGVKMGVSIPVSGDSNSGSEVTLGISVNPNTFKKNKITSQKEDLELQLELMNIENARSKFDETITEKSLKLEDILWQRSTNDNDYTIYESLEKDMHNWYKQGIVTESEYLSAKVNRQKSSVSRITNYIDMIIYNAEIKGLFVDGAEIMPVKQ